MMDDLELDVDVDFEIPEDAAAVLSAVDVGGRAVFDAIPGLEQKLPLASLG